MKKQSSGPGMPLPANYPCATFFVDESAAVESAGSSFVVAAVKLRRAGAFLRDIQTIREKHDHFGELKFSTITRARVGLFTDIIDALEASDARLSAAVVQRSMVDPFKGRPEWKAHASITAQLLAGNINAREIASAVLDQRSTPRDVAFDDAVRGMTNQKLGSLGLATAICADSKCNDGLQVADLVAGAVANNRRPSRGTLTNKARVARTLANRFGVLDFSADLRNDRVNVLTLTGDLRGRRGGQAKKSATRGNSVIEMRPNAV